ncbi:MAG: GNAT family protein [Chitinophagia bacterium]|jgi:RimJ/RimL family protein N-acetyltransferase|nr:N-acetyltransferase [Chitinophagia bacterium]
MLAQSFSALHNYILEDECVLLRPLLQDDANFLQYFSENEPEIWRYSLQTAAGADNLAQYIASAIQDREKGAAYPFIIFDKKNQQYAGSTRLYEIDIKNETTYLGYTWLGSAFQRTGINRHCKYLLLQFAFDQMGFHRVAFRADARNIASIQAMEAIGCKQEGILRDHLILPDGSRRTSVQLSILASEWQQTVKLSLQKLCVS